MSPGAMVVLLVCIAAGVAFAIGWYIGYQHGVIETTDKWRLLYDEQQKRLDMWRQACVDLGGAKKAA